MADIDDAVETVPDRRARTVHIDNYRMENGRQLCGPWPSARAAGGATSREWLGGGEDNPWISVRLWWFQFQSDASAHFDNHVDLMSSCQVWNELPTFERLDLLFEDGSTSITFRVFGRPDLTSSYSVIRDANVVMLVHLADGTTERVGSYLPLANDLFREVVADVAGDFPAFD